MVSAVLSPFFHCFVSYCCSTCRLGPGQPAALATGKGDELACLKSAASFDGSWRLSPAVLGTFATAFGGILTSREWGPRLPKPSARESEAGELHGDSKSRPMRLSRGSVAAARRCVWEMRVGDACSPRSPHSHTVSSRPETDRMAPRKAPRTEPDKVQLAFSQPLVKGLAAGELLKRLKALHLELADIDQDLIDTPSLDNVAKDLIQPSLLLHKEKGVKAYLACCLVDILRLYAPEAPYTQAELKVRCSHCLVAQARPGPTNRRALTLVTLVPPQQDLFQFLFRQLKHLTTAIAPHFSEYFYVIESLSNVKSIVIVCDLEHGDDLMAELFKQSFDVITRVCSRLHLFRRVKLTFHARTGPTARRTSRSRSPTSSRSCSRKRPSPAPR